MGLHVDNKVLQDAGLSERDALIEFACWLFDTERLELWPAAQLAGLSRPEMEGELRKRNIAIYRMTLEDFQHDLKTLGMLED
jgi:predicted HTH domain antitoxin